MSKSPIVLVVDDDREIRYSLDRVLSLRDYQVVTAASGEEALGFLKRETPDVIFLDIRMGGMSGIETLQHLRAANPEAMIILMTAYGTTQTAIEAMKFGAFDYIVKPFDLKKVIALTEAAFRARQDLMKTGDHKPLLNSDDYQEGIVGRSEAMQKVFKIIGQVAASDVTILITGESGTGKELVARCLFQHSQRQKKPFVAVNCAAIPDNLIESELFGHEKGAFTGATAQRLGKFEQCNGGTIFLDEIGDMTLATQTKILRVIQEGEMQRVGGADTIQVDVRILAATHRDLETMVREKAFREDLYYRLNVVRLRLPPLRERMEDVPELVEYCLQRLQKKNKARVKKVSPEALVHLVSYHWPGNVRELENVLHSSAVLAQGDVILIKDLPRGIQEAQPGAVLGENDTGERHEAETSGPQEVKTRGPQEVVEADLEVSPVSLRGAAGGVDEIFDLLYERMREEANDPVLSTMEREMVCRALKETGGNQVKASAILGITRATLRKRIEQFSLKS